MENVDQLLQSFRNEEADRCWIISQLEEVSDERVVSLFVNSLQDPEEDEGVRIEILKSLVMRRDRTDSHIRLAKAVLNVLQKDDSDVVRQHAANALYLFADVDGVLDCLESLVKSESEDIDVRHNALAAIASNRSLRDYRASLQRLVDVPELGRYAQRALDTA